MRFLAFRKRLKYLRIKGDNSAETKKNTYDFRDTGMHADAGIPGGFHGSSAAGEI